MEESREEAEVIPSHYTLHIQHIRHQRDMCCAGNAERNLCPFLRSFSHLFLFKEKTKFGTWDADDMERNLILPLLSFKSLSHTWRLPSPRFSLANKKCRLWTFSSLQKCVGNIIWLRVCNFMKCDIRSFIHTFCTCVAWSTLSQKFMLGTLQWKKKLTCLGNILSCMYDEIKMRKCEFVHKNNRFLNKMMTTFPWFFLAYTFNFPWTLLPSLYSMKPVENKSNSGDWHWFHEL